MGGSLIINSTPSEVRVALLENGTPAEVYLERLADLGVVGNIYRGRVVRVLPGMQAAFVDIGLERTAFLYVNDAMPRPAANPGTDVSLHDPHEESEPEAKAARRTGFRLQPAANISDVITQGQDLLLQVQKEPLGTKGARVSRHVSIPGRFLVYMPFSDHIGVSHRVSTSDERERLRQAMASICPPDAGFIVRTAAEGIDAEVLQREATMLMRLWDDIRARGSQGPTQRLVFSDLDLVLRATRDLFSDDVERIIVDTREDAERIRTFVQTFAPGREDRIEFYDRPEPIFDHFGIDVEIERALERRVWLKSGGYIVIDQAEALTVIDVNSGRYVGKSNLDDTITQINLEAIREIAYQLRLRNIGGIVIIDFIDMADGTNREKVLSALAEALTRDKAKTAIVRMSEIGLVEMTRKRVRESLGQVMTQPCTYCKGRGFIKSPETVAHQVIREITRQLNRAPAATVHANIHPDVAEYFYETNAAEIERLEKSHHTRIIPVPHDHFHREQYSVVVAPAGG